MKGQKNAEQRCSAENKIKKLCVEQKKGDNKTDVKSNKYCSISLTQLDYTLFFLNSQGNAINIFKRLTFSAVCTNNACIYWTF